MKKILIISMLGCAISVHAQRTETQIRNWRFTHEDNAAQADVDYNDRKWQQVTVPHDWAIGGPFDKEIDKQVVAIEQNGEKEATEKTGRSGSLPWIGTGWYRTTINVSPTAERVILNFDAAMAEPEVFVNGRKAGEWKYGYNAFSVDITPYLVRTFADKQNAEELGVRSQGVDNHPSPSPQHPSPISQTVAVRLQNVEESSRWYPGAGLIRPVTLIETGKTALDEWGLNAVTLALADGNASEQLSASVVNPEGRNLIVEFDVAQATFKKTKDDSADSSTAIKQRKTLFCEAAKVGKDGCCTVCGQIDGIQPWTPETPHLYQLCTTLYEIGDDGSRTKLDQIVKKIGFRTVKITPPLEGQGGGFMLNGVTRKIKGVCLHHDLGMIGAAVNKAALLRQLKLLKTMGCDAIRTSHNMPSQMQMDLCDSLGLMVMAESFDMWAYPKCKNGYARFFGLTKPSQGGGCPNETWSDADIRNLVCANRLHPSIIMWSVGNEIPEQGAAEGAKLLRHLQDQVRRYDASRPITNGMDKIEAALKSGFAQVADCPGMNYRTHLYNKAHEGLGQGYVLGSETASTVSSRGVYKFPVVRADGKAYSDGQCSSYDTEACWWSNIPEEDWLLQDGKPWVIGEFVWTGFDYLGEPTPYDEYWPSRSSYFGIFDLAGLPKDRYYLYRSRWNTAEATTHILPHWTWPGREGQVTPVYVYTSYPSAELFVNGKSQGRRIKNTSVTTGAGKDGKITDINDPALDRYRLRWNDVRYEPGEATVVFYDAKGNKAATEAVHTAGKAAVLTVTGDELLDGGAIRNLKADGDDMVFLTVSVRDANGNLCPDAANEIKVSVKGAATFRGICNGDATSLEVFTKPVMKVFHGQLVIGIQAKDIPGDITVTVTSAGLKSAKCTIHNA